MSEIKEAPIKKWSFSRLRDFEACAYREYLRQVVKAPVPVRGPDNPLARGEKIHKLAEDFIKGTIQELPKELSRFAAEFAELQRDYPLGKIFVEENWGATEEWESCGFWDDGVWGRFKIDVAKLLSETAARVIDWKTGKGHFGKLAAVEQGQLYAVVMFMRMPDLETVETHFNYLDTGESRRRIYTRMGTLAHLNQFTRRAKAMTTATKFPARPSSMTCKYCDFGVEGSATCDFRV